MSHLQFDEKQVMANLDRISARLRVAFAAACAERLFTTYEAYHAETGKGDPNSLRQALDRVWDFAFGTHCDANEIKAELDRCSELMPDDSERGSYAPYADDACAAVAYAWRTAESEVSQEAAWAARRAYEALDLYVQKQLDVDWGDPGSEPRVLLHPLVQSELGRQATDMEMLTHIETKEELLDLRARAKQDGASIVEERDAE